MLSIEEIEKKYDKQFIIVFKAIKELLEPPPVKSKPPIGFRVYDEPKKDALDKQVFLWFTLY